MAALREVEAEIELAVGVDVLSDDGTVRVRDAFGATSSSIEGSDVLPLDFGGRLTGSITGKGGI